MLVKTTITTKDAGLIKAYRDSLARAPQLTAQVMQRTVSRVAPRALAPFQREGSPVTYPIRWQSERQRRAFFASNGFGKNIPYRRTGKLNASYKIGVTTSATELPSVYLTNPVSYRKFVVGRYQQRMFGGRWFKERTLIRQARELLADEVETDLIKVLFIIDEGTYFA